MEVSSYKKKNLYSCEVGSYKKITYIHAGTVLIRKRTYIHAGTVLIKKEPIFMLVGRTVFIIIPTPYFCIFAGKSMLEKSFS